MIGFVDKKIAKIYLGQLPIGDTSEGAAVLYYIDEGNYKQLYVENGTNVLSLLTPTKSGYEFVGWREDTLADDNVPDVKIMSGTPITLYAVFKKKVTLTLYNDSTTPSNTEYTVYYNNGILGYNSVTISQKNKSNWSKRGWSTSTEADSPISVKDGGIVSITSNLTYYGCYQQDITLSYNGNGSTSGATEKQNGIRYYNSSGKYLDPVFILRDSGFSRDNYQFSKWDLGNAGDKVKLSKSTIAYAQWELPSTYSVYTAQLVDSYYKYTGNLINSEYVTYSFSGNPLQAGAHVNNEYGSESEQQNHGTITINYNGFYTRAVIELYDSSNNEHGNDREAWYRYWISGDNESGWQSITSSIHTIIMYANADQTVLNLGVRAQINGDNSGLYTWVDSALAIKSITLYK